MAASPLLRLLLQLPGTNVNLWGELLNNQVFRLLEQAIAGVGKIPLTDSVTLTSENFVLDQARNAVLIFSAGSGLAAAPTITVPNVQKVWLVINNTGFVLTFSASGSTTTVPVGRTAFVIYDGDGLIKFDPVSATADLSAAAQAAATVASQAATTATTQAGAAAGSATAAATALTLLNAKFIISTAAPSGGSDGDVWFRIA